MNLLISLEDEDVSAYTLADLLTNSDVMNTLEKTIIEKPSTFYSESTMRCCLAKL